jgi:long-chain fatty acid transport protein
MKNTTQSAKIAAAIVAGLLVAQTGAWALGFRNPDQGARATGQGEAFAAQADDASAIYYNPAGLTQVKGTQFTSGGYLSFPNVNFDIDGGGSVQASEQVVLLPHAYVATDLKLDRWRFGLGVNVPYGNRVEYDAAGPFSSLVTRSEMAVFNIAPTAAYQINDQLSVGAGVNIYLGRTEVARISPFGPFEFEGAGLGVGGTLGLLWKPTAQHSVAVVYRTPFRITFDGDVVIGGGAVVADGQATILFPQTVTVGYAFRPTPKLKLEADIEWTDWSTLNTVKLESSNSLIDSDTAPIPTATPFNWRSSFFYEFGVEYQCNDHWTVRGGYIFSENTVPESTPTIPDSDRHVFSAGLTFNHGRWNVNATYQFSYSVRRNQTIDTDGPLIPGGELTGQWRNTGHALMLTSTVRF